MTREIKLLKSRSIFTGKDNHTLDGFVVVEGNRILDVLPLEACGELKKNGEIYDYGDQTIMPSFHDAHVHVIIGALSERGGFLRDAESEEAAASLLYNLNCENSQAKWILGGAWDHFKWPGCKLPSKASLDKYFPDQMVFLLNKECHGAWVNSKTLEFFGITAETPNPKFGEIFRDEHGEPTGYMHETAGSNLLREILKQMDVDELGEYVKEFNKKAFSLGMTSVSDMQISEISAYETYERLEERGSLNMRIHYAAPLSYPTEKLLELKEKHCSERLRFSGTKDFVDGTPMGHTGLMLDPYLDMPNCKGAPTINLDFMGEKIIELHDVGIRTRLHACGDGAVRAALDSFEEAQRRSVKTGIRHTIEHIEACSPDDIPRFGELGVIASVQPDHLPKYDFPNHPFHQIIGEERMKYSWPFHSLEKNGACIAFGSDYPVAELTPFRGLYRAVTRLTDDGGPQGGFNPHEKMSLGNSLRAYTLGAAYCNEREHDLGTLEKGKLADIAILDRDIFNTKPEEIINMNVIATMFDGVFVFEK